MNLYFINYKLAKLVVFKLKEKGLTLSAGESCSGGLLSSYITDIPSSSEVFLGSIVAYSVYAKNKLLDIPIDDINKYKTVSEFTAKNMAKSVMQKFNSDLAVSITGFCGPSASENLYPGIVYIAIHYLAKSFVYRYNFKIKKREILKHLAVRKALKLILQVIGD